MTATFLLRQYVYLRFELGVRGDRTRLGEHLAALDFFLVDTTKQGADVVAGLPGVEELAEHLDAGTGRLLGGSQTDDLDLFANLDLTLLDLAGHHGAATRDGEDVFDRHEERLVDIAYRLRHERVYLRHELEDAGSSIGVALERLERGDAHHGDIVAREAVGAEELTNLEFDELEQLVVVDHVDLVQRDDDGRHADLAGEQDVLTGLRHRAVGGGDDEDCSVDLRSTGDHVLDVVGVSGHVDVRIVTVLGLVLDVRHVDRDAALALFGRLVDVVERGEHGARAAVGEHLRDRRGKRGLAVVDVAHRAHVDVGLVALERLLRHGSSLALSLLACGWCVFLDH
ncbi:unannotated protein [freshwater metagenome]|uniref:Unannotated protein n=1 Tax=freshwater metagenome TaxID=449393 RepID=A0A6J7AD29_9ZZZZ